MKAPSGSLIRNYIIHKYIAEIHAETHEDPVVSQ